MRVSGQLPDARVRPALSLQRWEHLTFVHWRYPAEVLWPFVPRGLALQVLDGDAWVGLTPFVLGGLRVPGVPPVPRWSTFVEINLRTYVTDARHDGVLFLRVHCARRAVVALFRAGLGLPYGYVPGVAGATAGQATYAAAGTRGEVEVGAPLAPDGLVASLTGRWSAFTRHAGAVWRIPVEHDPWPLHQARLVSLRTDLFARAGLPDPVGDAVVHFSPGVHVRIGAPRPAAVLPHRSTAPL